MRPFVLAVAFSLCLNGESQLRAYSLLDSSWLLGSYVPMHLDLGLTTVTLQDGNATWAASAADALQIWNAQLTALRLVPLNNTPTSHVSGDHYNSVFFSATIFGQSFGMDTLAVTVRLSNVITKASTEADVLVNQSKHFNSYRGPLQYNTAIGDYIYDIHRVFLHEFGHVLGLDHPDEHGQAVDAIMNSVIGDRDSLSSDDIAGGRSLYTSLYTPATLGSPYSFVIKAAPTVAHFTASGLPPDITLNPSSGIISGIPTVRGLYSPLITLVEAGTTLQFTLVFQISTSVVSAGIIKANLNLQAESVIADPVRPQVYVTLPVSNSVGVFDTSSLTVTKTVPVGLTPRHATLSRDRSKLFVANSGSATDGISEMDLATLQVTSHIALPYAPSAIAEGADGRLYVTAAEEPAALMIVDPHSHTVTQYSSDTFYWKDALLTSNPAGTTLYGGTYASTGRLEKIDISGPEPVSLASSPWHDLGENAEQLKISNRGDFLLYPNGTGNGGGADYSTSKISVNTLARLPGVFATGPYPGVIALSNDDAVVCEYVANQSVIDIFDTVSFALLRKIDSTANRSLIGYDAKDLTLDNTNTLLIAAMPGVVGTGDLRVFTSGLPAVVKPAALSFPPMTLRNVSTRALVGTGDNVEIAGFILKGTTPTKVILRALARSLASYGVEGVLADPILELHDSAGTVIASNDNWNFNRQTILGSGYAPTDDREAAIIATLLPGSYTAVLRGVSQSVGVALVELYDIDPQNSRIANISTRGTVGTNDNVMIAGFIVAGSQATHVVVRALGPTLSSFHVAGALQDPILELHDPNGALIAVNDDWASEQQQELVSSGYAPPDAHEPAILANLIPGNYTAIVKGKDSASGVALVEVYNLNAR